MTADDLRPLLAANPFAKFYLTVTDGASYEVGDPGQVSFPSDGVMEFQAKGRRTLIALGHVVCIEFPSTAGDPFFLRGRA